MGSPFTDTYWTNTSLPELRPVKVTRFDPKTGKILEGEGEVILPAETRRKPVTRSCRYCGKAFETYRRDSWPDARICPKCERERRSARARERHAREREQKALHPAYVVFDKLTGRRVTSFATVAEAAEGLGITTGLVTDQVAHDAWSKGWLAVRSCNQLHDSSISSRVAPVILDDGAVKVAFACSRDCADALGIDISQLRNEKVSFQGRTCKVVRVTRHIDDDGIRRWPPEANKSLLPSKMNA